MEWEAGFAACKESMPSGGERYAVSGRKSKLEVRAFLYEPETLNIPGGESSPFLRVYTNTTAAGTQSLKAACGRHKNCVCWVNRRLTGDSRISLLRDYIEWAVAGSPAEHAAGKILLRAKYKDAS